MERSATPEFAKRVPRPQKIESVQKNNNKRQLVGGNAWTIKDEQTNFGAFSKGKSY
jgi:hypothetical protein